MVKKPKNTLRLKEKFIKRMGELLPDEKDNNSYWEILKILPTNSIRCNTLKISPGKLAIKLNKKGWKITQPWKSYPEVMIIEGKIPTGNPKEILINKNLAKLEPGELGRSIEHFLGYYYIQELASMLPLVAMTFNENDFYLDLCAAPGSKTTQAAAKMENKGTIIANEMSLGRMRILSSNLERCSVTNTIITRKEGRALCRDFEKGNIFFDKILLDAPCSGEGTLRSTPKTSLMWNPKTIKSFSHLQKTLFEKAFKQLKVNGEMIYSTCTHAPEENEGVIDYALKRFKEEIEIMPFELPIKTRQGIIEWNGKRYDKKVKLSKRIYPHDNNTEGFFICKFKRVKIK